MQVLAFATPLHPDWRWRIVNFAGETVEESSQRFPSIATAVTEGTRRMNELNAADLSQRSYTFLRGTSHFRNR